jgi:hypothetical protein
VIVPSFGVRTIVVIPTGTDELITFIERMSIVVDVRFCVND